MRITQWGEYGVHCTAFIAKQQQLDVKAVPAADIAADQNIALDYVQQILQRLRKGGLVKSVRGPTGGYLLARPASEITLRDILIASEGDTFEVICETKPIKLECCTTGSNCNLRPLWFALKDHVNSFLVRFTLQQIIDDSLGLPEVEERPFQINAVRLDS